MNFQKLNTLNYHNHSFNEILNLDGVYIIEYIHNGNDHNNIMHTLVVDGYGKNVCDSNYGVVKYKDLNINNYYFLKLVSIYGVSKSYKRKKKKKKIQLIKFPIELKKGNVCKAYKDGRWWGGFLLSKVHNNHATIKWEVYGGQEHLKCEPINSEREFLKLIPLNKLKLTIK